MIVQACIGNAFCMVLDLKYFRSIYNQCMFIINRQTQKYTFGTVSHFLESFIFLLNIKASPRWIRLCRSACQTTKSIYSSNRLATFPLKSGRMDGLGMFLISSSSYITRLCNAFLEKALSTDPNNP